MKERLTPKGGFAKIENMFLIKGYVVNGIEVIDMLNRFAEYEDLEEQGLLVRLPCKVGDTIYVVRQDYTLTREGKTIDDSYIDKLEVTAILFDCTTIRIYHNAFVNEDDYTSIEHIGKWAFFTLAEAEKKLAELKGDKKCIKSH